MLCSTKATVDGCHANKHPYHGITTVVCISLDILHMVQYTDSSTSSLKNQTYALTGLTELDVFPSNEPVSLHCTQASSAT